MVDEYTNRELGILIKDGFKGVHDRQDKTNGNVTKNCGEISDLKGFKNRVLGALIIINVILIPLVFMAVTQVVKASF